MLKKLHYLSLALLLALLPFLSACTQKLSDEEIRETSTAPSENTTVLHKEYEDLSAALLLSPSQTELSSNAKALTLSFDRTLENQEFSLLKKQKRHDLEPSHSENAASTIQSVIKSGCNILITADGNAEKIFLELCKEYPDVYFFCEGGKEEAEENYYCFSARIYEGFYLAGILAASESESNHLAFLSDKETSSAEKYIQANAFTLGAQTVNPDVQVYLQTVNTEDDAQKIASSLSAKGCEVFTGNIPAKNGYQLTGTEEKRYISLAGDEKASEAVIGNISINYEPFLTSAFRAIADGETLENTYYGGLNEGAVDFSFNENQVSETAARAIDTATELISNGRFAIFSGFRLNFNESNSLADTIFPSDFMRGDEILIEKGDSALSDDILRSMDFCVDGLVEINP